jgi:hypothetical protein
LGNTIQEEQIKIVALQVRSSSCCSGTGNTGSALPGPRAILKHTGATRMMERNGASDRCENGPLHDEFRNKKASRLSQEKRAESAGNATPIFMKAGAAALL